MVIRLATIDEVPRLMRLVRKIVPSMQAAGNFQWDESYPNPEVFLRDIELGQLWVADIGVSETHVYETDVPEIDEVGIIGGFAAITTDQSPEYAQVGWNITEKAIVIHRLAVDPDRRGFGIATALMDQAQDIAFGSGINILRVDTNIQNEPTQKLFPKLGYTLAGEITLDFRPGQRFLCYEKRLPEYEERLPEA